MITNVLDYLENAAEKYTEKIAYSDEIEALSFGETKKRAKAIGSYISGYIEKGNPVAVYMEKSAAAITAFLG